MLSIIFMIYFKSIQAQTPSDDEIHCILYRVAYFIRDSRIPKRNEKNSLIKRDRGRKILFTNYY